MSRLIAFAQSVDWTLLREQKLYLLNEADNDPVNGDLYHGVVQLIDGLQDAVVADGLAPEKRVFCEDGIAS